MKNINFPIHKTKVRGVTQNFNLTDPSDRQAYFAAKAGKEIKKLQKYLQKNTFVGYLLGKKNSGKGTYTKLFMEAVGEEHIGHVAIGDIVRDVHESLAISDKKAELVEFLKKNYRGFHNLEETIALIEGRGTGTLIPSELILSLIKFEISKRPKKAIFLDGFPRAVDQISYSLFLKELIGYRDDPDFLVFIDLPEAIIDERIKYRVVCPKCKSPRNLKLLATKEVGYDREKGEYYLICDNPNCQKHRMVAKEGDSLGIEPIRKRLEVDDQIFRQLLALHGVPKIYLRNSVPVEKAKAYIDDYEITPEFKYSYDENSAKITVRESPWVVEDDNGKPSYSLLPPAVVVSFIKQTVEVLELK